MSEPDPWDVRSASALARRTRRRSAYSAIGLPAAVRGLAAPATAALPHVALGGPWLPWLHHWPPWLPIPGLSRAHHIPARRALPHHAVRNAIFGCRSGTSDRTPNNSTASPSQDGTPFGPSGACPPGRGCSAWQTAEHPSLRGAAATDG